MSFNHIIKKPISDAKGFTLMELMVVVALVGILSAIAIFNYMPMRAKSLDSMAHSDARNIVASIVGAVTDNADVDFNIPAVVNTSGPIGAFQNGGAPRKRIFTLSQGVNARIIAGSNSIALPGGNNTIFEAYVFHTGGTRDKTGLALSGRKEFYCLVDADLGVSLAPQ